MHPSCSNCHRESITNDDTCIEINGITYNFCLTCARQIVERLKMAINEEPNGDRE